MTMNKAPSKGKAPVKDKQEDYSFLDVENDFFALDKELRQELKEKGLVCRFINAKNYMTNHGFHRNGWKVYKRAETSAETRGSLDFSMGTDPEGYVRRGDLVLAVKPSAHHKKYQEKVQFRNKAQQGFAKKAAKDLEETARKGGIRDYEILEGYENND